MSSTNPLVTIIIPSFNHGNYIEKCIKSIFSQTYTNFELIVIDDGSEDNSHEILRQLKQEFNFQLEFQKNIGLSNTLNRGYKEYANGKYLTFCASDDYWLPEKLQKQVDFLESHLDYGMVYGKAYIIDSFDNIVQPDTFNENMKLKGGDIFKDLILLNFHPPVNYMFRENIIRELNFYRSGIWAEDFDMNLRIAAHYKIGYIEEYLICYRKTLIGKAKMLTYKTVYSHLESIKLFQDSPYYREAISRWHYRCFIWYCRYKESKLFAIRGMLNSLRYFYKKEFLKALLIWILRWQ